MIVYDESGHYYDVNLSGTADISPQADSLCLRLFYCIGNSFGISYTIKTLREDATRCKRKYDCLQQSASGAQSEASPSKIEEFRELMRTCPLCSFVGKFAFGSFLN